MTLLEELRSLEVELHHPGVRCSRDRLEALLHPEFHEVGRSGRAYTRQTVIDCLAAQASPPTVLSHDFSVSLLAPAVALLVYRSAQPSEGRGLTLRTLRSSIWIQTDAGWKLRYHHGTPASDAPA